jgi:sulfite reductase (NADPH) hemoprotein beta-component
VNPSSLRILADPCHAQLMPQAEFDRVAACFARPPACVPVAERRHGRCAPALRPLAAAQRARPPAARLPAVTLSLKRAGLPPGDVTADQMEAAAELAERYSQGELRVTPRPEPAAALGAKAICARCGWPPAKPASPRPTSACSPT